MTWKNAVLGLVVCALAACGPDMNTTDTGPADTNSGTDATSGNDVQSGTDSQAGNDVQSGTDATSGTDGSAGGMCGASVNTCLCGCGNNAACQQGCIGMSQACGQCVLGAQSMCCPAEANAFAMCVQRAQMASDAGPACTDQACIQQRCMTEVTAFQNCVTTASSSDATCQGYLGTCFGSYPIMCQ